MSRTVIAVAEGLSKLFAAAAVLLLVAAMLVICQMVFARYFFRWELPKVDAQLDLLSSVDTTTLDMRDAWF